MDPNQRKVLEMLSQGKITPEEAERLLDKLGQGEPKSSGKEASVEAKAAVSGGPRVPRVKVKVEGVGDLMDSLGSMIEKTTAQVNEVIESAEEQAWGVDVEIAGDALTPGEAESRQGESGGVAYSESYSYASNGVSAPAQSASYGSTASRAVSTSSSEGAMKEESRTVEVAQVAGKALRVRAENGAVRVTPGSGNAVTIRATIRAETEERLEETKISAERSADGTLAIEPVWPAGGRRPNEGCGFEVAILDARGIDVQTSNGDIDLTGMGGKAELKTDNGSVTVRSQAGGVRVKTTNGSITLDGVEGRAVARTNNAKIRISGATGPVEAKNSNGPVDVQLSSDNEGPIQVVTNNAKVRLALSQVFKGALHLKTSNGKVKFDKPEHVQVIKSGHSSARLRVGEGGSPSSVKTNNGAIRVSFEK